MAQTFDLILRAAPSSTRTARACATSASTAGRIAAIGDLSHASAGETVDCRGPARAARRDRHPGAFPRAGPDPQGRPGNRLAQRRHGRRHRGVRDAEHQSADHHRARRWPTRSGAATTACIAISRSSSAARARMCTNSPSWNGCRAAAASRCSWARRPARCWSRTTTACATSSRRSGAAPRFIPRTKIAAATSASVQRVEGDPRSHPVWRDETAALTLHASGWSRLARETGKRVHVLHISTAEEIDFPAATTRTSPRSR